METERSIVYGEELARLIRIPTISTEGQRDIRVFYDFHRELEQLFPHLFAQVEKEDFDGSLLLRWKGSGSGKPILLMNHFDVVEASGTWKYPPFSGTIAEGRLWGRGTLDTKGGLYCMLKAADELAAQGVVPKQDIYFESACTEETDGAGAKAIALELKRRGIRFAFALDEGGMITYDPVGGVDATYALIGVGEKTCVDLKFIARSKGGHASTPGRNTPLVRLGRFMAAADRGRIFPAKLPEPVEEMFLRMTEHMKRPLKTVFRKLLKTPGLLAILLTRVSSLADAFVHTTVAFTMSKGSDSINVLPREAWIVGDMRVSHHQGRDRSIKALRRLAKRYGVEVEVMDAREEYPLADFRGEAFRLVERAVQAGFEDVHTAPYIMNGASDCSFLAKVCDQCLHFVPFVVDEQQLGSIHAIDENVDLSTLAPAVDFYKYLIQEV